MEALPFSELQPATGQRRFLGQAGPRRLRSPEGVPDHLRRNQKNTLQPDVPSANSGPARRTGDPPGGDLRQKCCLTADTAAGIRLELPGVDSGAQPVFTGCR